MNRQELFDYAKREYGSSPEYLWERSPDVAVLRHTECSKWYGIVMSVSPSVFGMDGGENIDIINLKCRSDDIDFFRRIKGIMPAYHMNKTHWISVFMDGSVDDNLIKDLMDTSYRLTLKAARKG